MSTESSPIHPQAAPILAPRQRSRLLLLSAAIISFCILFWASRLFRIPIHPYEQGLLLQQPSPAVTFLLILATLAACAAMGTAVAGIIRFSAGLVTAGIGLVALSVRSGTIRDVLFNALAVMDDPRRVFLLLAAETALLGFFFLFVWLLLRKVHRDALLIDRAGLAARFSETSSSDMFLSFSIQVVATGLILLALAATEEKKQVLVALFAASFLGCWIAQSLFPTSPRTPTWLPPLIVGIAGYLLSYISPDGLPTASLTNWAAPLAFPLPIDYAGIGIASATLGHWVSRK